ncbi:MAG: rhomboid family intramembrane serine protease, partial [Candidatus Binatia bacterium]
MSSMRGYGSPRRGGPFGIGLGPEGPIPAAIKGLMIANLSAYVLQVVGGQNFFLVHFSLVGPLVLSGELWRLASYQFLHGGIWHLGLNMLMLWMFGSELEQRWGSAFFLKYYFLCGVGGGLLYTLFMYDAMVPSVGA